VVFPVFISFTFIPKELFHVHVPRLGRHGPLSPGWWSDRVVRRLRCLCLLRLLRERRLHVQRVPLLLL
jgi:hypothetical protein